MELHLHFVESDMAGGPARKEVMMCKVVSSKQIGRTPLCLIFLLSHSVLAQDNTAAATGAPDTTLRAIHILGFEQIPSNAEGQISIQEKALRFQKKDGSAAEVALGSIQGVVLGEQDKQVGGTPMTLGKVAAPFGGGRVISLFAHKKYDVLTIEYVDSNGGLHGAIFQLQKGEADNVRNALVSSGAHVSASEAELTKQKVTEAPIESK